MYCKEEETENLIDHIIHASVPFAFVLVGLYKNTEFESATVELLKAIQSCLSKSEPYLEVIGRLEGILELNSNARCSLSLGDVITLEVTLESLKIESLKSSSNVSNKAFTMIPLKTENKKLGEKKASEISSKRVHGDISKKVHNLRSRRAKIMIKQEFESNSAFPLSTKKKKLSTKELKDLSCSFLNLDDSAYKLRRNRNIPKLSISIKKSESKALASKNMRTKKKVSKARSQVIQCEVGNCDSLHDNGRIKNLLLTEDEPSQPLTRPLQSAKIFKLVNNIGYTVLDTQNRKKVAYKCFLPKCHPALMDEFTFVNHLKAEHFGVAWYSYCNICADLAAFHENPSIFDEMRHLKDFHVVNEASIHNFIYDLRPWMDKKSQKLSAVSTMMIHENCLTAAYKCMENECIFFTSRADLFAIHLRIHKAHQSNSSGYECAYCVYQSNDPDALVAHISTVHKHDVYQCGFCFYRSASCTNTQSHIKIYHPEKKILIIECMPRSRINETRSRQAVRSSENLSKTIPALTCVECDESFFLFDAYTNHIKSHTKENSIETKPKCAKCKTILDTATMFQHFETCLSIGLYQCAYCVFGCSLLEILKHHNANLHPTKLPYYHMRASNEKVDVKCPSSLKLKYVTHKPMDIILIRKFVTFEAIVNAKNSTSINFHHNSY